MRPHLSPCLWLVLFLLSGCASYGTFIPVTDQNARTYVDSATVTAQPAATPKYSAKIVLPRVFEEGDVIKASVTVANNGNSPIEFDATCIRVSQQGPGVARNLHVYTYDEHYSRVCRQIDQAHRHAAEQAESNLRRAEQEGYKQFTRTVTENVTDPKDRSKKITRTRDVVEEYYDPMAAHSARRAAAVENERLAYEAERRGQSLADNFRRTALPKNGIVRPHSKLSGSVLFSPVEVEKPSTLKVTFSLGDTTQSYSFNVHKTE